MSGQTASILLSRPPGWDGGLGLHSAQPAGLCRDRAGLASPRMLRCWPPTHADSMARSLPWFWSHKECVGSGSRRTIVSSLPILAGRCRGFAMRRLCARLSRRHTPYTPTNHDICTQVPHTMHRAPEHQTTDTPRGSATSKPQVQAGQSSNQADSARWSPSLLGQWTEYPRAHIMDGLGSWNGAAHSSSLVAALAFFCFP